MSKKTTEQFIKEAEEIHKDENGNPLFSYEKAKYVTNQTKVIIYCKKCQKDFEITPNAHLSKKRGCQECGAERRKKFGESLRHTNEEFVRLSLLIHRDEKGNPLYNYDQVEYVNGKTNVKIWCIKGEHFFEQRGTLHLQGNRCVKCSVSRKLDTEEFIQKAKNRHKDEEGNPLYIYDEVEYINSKTSVIVKCKNNHKFIIQPQSHLQGRQCRRCGINKTQKIFLDFLNHEYGENTFVTEKKFNDCKNINHLLFDYYSEKFNLVIELDGRQHFKETNIFKEPLEHRQKIDFYKMKYLQQNNINIIRIFQEDVYYNSYDWREDIKNHVKEYESFQIFYLSKCNKYIEYKKKYEEYLLNNCDETINLQITENELLEEDDIDDNEIDENL
jgi:very-short-patch-repair endonuclease